MVQARSVHAKHSMLSSPECGIYRMAQEITLLATLSKFCAKANYSNAFRILIYENLVRRYNLADQKFSLHMSFKICYCMKY
jgi:hypothetical protein